MTDTRGGEGMSTTRARFRVPVVLSLILVVLAALPRGAPSESPLSAPVVAMGSTPHAPILIVGNAQFTPANGVVGGQGTAASPYLIRGWRIDASAANGVEVRNTTAHFVVDHLDVCCGSSHIGISFFNVTDATVMVANVTTSLVGLHIDHSNRVNAFGGNFSSSSNASEVWSSSHVNVSAANLTSSHGVGLSANMGNQLDLWSDVVYTPQGKGMTLVSSSDVRAGDDSFDGYGSSVDVPDVLTTAAFVGNTFSSWWETGLSLNRANYVTVRGNLISGYPYGLTIGGGHDDLLGSNTIIGGVSGCVYVSFVGNLTITANTVSGCINEVLDLEKTGANVVVEGNNFTFAQNGILLDQAYGATVRANRFNGLGIRLAGNDVEAYTNLTITPDNLISGLPILYSKDCGNVAYDRASAGEIIAANCTSLSVSNMSFWSGSVAIQAAYMGTVNLHNLSFSLQNDSGFVLYHVGNASVDRSSFFWDVNGENATDVGVFSLANSTFSWPGHGLLVNGGIVNLRNLTFDGLPFGTVLIGVTGGMIQDNRFHTIGYNEAGSGVALTAISSAGVSVVNNTFAGNMYGVNLFGDRDFLVYHNQFDENGFGDAYDDSGGLNRWNASYPVGGNNWTAYHGWDDCWGPLQDICTHGDGIGDIPYHVPSSWPVDYYPLVAVNPPKVWPVAQLSASMPMVFVGQPVQFTSSSYDPTGFPLASLTYSFGDGTSYTGLVFATTHIYNAPGNYTVRLTAESLRHLTNSTSTTISVLSELTAVIAPQPAYLYVGQSVRFDGTNSSEVYGSVVNYTWDVTGAVPATYYGSTVFVRFAASGPQTVTLTVTGTQGERASATLDLLVKDDLTPPQVRAEVAGTGGAGGWYRGNVTLTLSATDNESGVQLIQCRVGSGPWRRYISSILFTEGNGTVQYRAEDWAGNVAPAGTIVIRVDATPPVLQMNPFPSVETGPVVIAWSGHDNLSGIVGYQVSVDGGPREDVGAQTSFSVSLPDGTHTLSVWASDIAGNNASVSANFRVDTNPFSPSGPFAGAPTYALIAGVVVLAAVVARRRKRRNPPDSKPD